MTTFIPEATVPPLPPSLKAMEDKMTMRQSQLDRTSRMVKALQSDDVPNGSARFEGNNCDIGTVSDSNTDDENELPLSGVMDFGDADVSSELEDDIPNKKIAKTKSLLSNSSHKGSDSTKSEPKQKSHNPTPSPTTPKQLGISKQKSISAKKTPSSYMKSPKSSRLTPSSSESRQSLTPRSIPVVDIDMPDDEYMDSNGKHNFDKLKLNHHSHSCK